MIDSLQHHAYCLVGPNEEIIPNLLKRLDELGVQTRGHPDVFVCVYDVFGIDDARFIKEAQGRRVVSGGKKVFLMSVFSMTREAQNALLKVFEEPSPATHFFIVAPTAEILLPTLRSRLHFVDNGPPRFRSAQPNKSAAFIALPVAARLKKVHALLTKMEKGEIARSEVLAFLDGLEIALAGGKFQASMRAEALKNLLLCKKYGRDRAPSFKLILEHLALTLPH